MQILVLTTEPISADQLRGALRSGTDPADARVMLIAPALHENALQFWVSDADDAIARADAVRLETLRKLGEDGVSAAAQTGDADPERAIVDALKTFAADQIVIFRHADSGDQRYREDVDVDALSQRVGVAITEAKV